MGHQYFIKTDQRLNDDHALSVRYRADSRGSTGNGIGGLNTKERGNNTNTLDQDVVSAFTSVLGSNLLNELRVQFSRRSTFSDTERLQRGRHAADQPSLRRTSAKPRTCRRAATRTACSSSTTSATRAARTTSSSAPTSASSAPKASSLAIGTATSRSRPTRRSTRRIWRPIRRNTSWPSWIRSWICRTTSFRSSRRTSGAIGPTSRFNLGLRYDRERGFRKITGVPDDGNNFQPRLGVVWDPWNDGRTAIRGGYGHYVDQSFLNIQLNVASAKDAVEIVIANPGYPGSVSRAARPRRRRRAPPPSRRSRARRKRAPPASASSASSSPGLAVSVDGVYSRGYNQYAWNDLNYPNPVTGVRPDPSVGRVIVYADYGNSWYSALLVGLEQREFHGAAWNAVVHAVEDAARRRGLPVHAAGSAQSRGRQVTGQQPPRASVGRQRHLPAAVGLPARRGRAGAIGTAVDRDDRHRQQP